MSITGTTIIKDLNNIFKTVFEFNHKSIQGRFPFSYWHRPFFIPGLYPSEIKWKTFSYLDVLMKLRIGLVCRGLVNFAILLKISAIKNTMLLLLIQYKLYILWSVGCLIFKVR